MTRTLRTFALLAALLAVGGALAACSSAADDGRYATQDRGRGSNRA